jgi:TonB-linked SusC/RagA family outer membrane protein
MMKNKLFLFLLGCCLSVVSLTAQTTKISGVVKDDKGQPLPGATVQIFGTTKGTLTDLDGNFSLEASPTDVLQISFVGFDPVKTTVGTQTTLDISLTTGNVLEEVVISGYGIETIRRDATGASSKIDKASLESTAPISITEVMQGRAAGVNIVSADGSPGAGASINIRGFSSLSAGTSPLIVIDNIPYIVNSSDATNPLATLNPNDIQSVDILKDASATALYGVGASNGVIVITTKKGQKGKPRINLSVKRGTGQLARQLETLTPTEYALYRADRIRSDAGDNAGLTSSILFPGQPSAWELLANPTGANIDADPFKILTDQYGVTNFEGTNWLDVITRDAKKEFYDLNFSGSTEGGTSYFGSLGFANEEGAIINSNFRRISGLLNLEQKLSSMLTAGVKLQYTNSNYGGLIGDWRADNAIAQSNFLNPYINRDNILGNTSGITNNGGQGAGPESPEYRINSLETSRGSDWLAGNVNLSLKPVSWLELAVNAGLITDNFKRDYYAPSFLREAQNSKGRVDLETGRDSRLVIQPRLAINKKFDGGHSFNATFVFEARKETQTSNFTRYEQFNTEVLKSNSLAAAKSIVSTPNFQDKRDRSYIGRVQYNYKSRYILTASTRIDESSRFINDRQGIFPAVSAAWNVSEEGFMKPLEKIISTFKIRAGYGITGNNQIPVNAGVSLANLANVSYPFNNALNTAVNPSTRFANPDITWETTKGTNLGVDVGFIKDRFTLTTNVYRNVTTGLLLDIQLPAYSSFTSAIQNLGSLENKGLEFEAVSRNFTGKFSWTTNFNISFNRNKVLDLGGQPEIGFRAIGTGSLPNDVILRVGKPIGVYYGTIQDGLINNDFERYNATPKIQDHNTGEFDYFDIDGNGIIERTEYVPMAYTLPIHTGGIGNTLSYKGFDLYAFLRWSYGNDIVNNNLNRAHYLRGDLNLQRNVASDIWNRQNENRNYQGYAAIFTTRINSLFSRSEMVEDGSYLRLETVRLSYSLPTKLLKKYKVGATKIYLTGQNLGLLTRYSWYDPEVNAARGNNRQLFPGLDQGAYPRTRTLLAGLDLSF